MADLPIIVAGGGIGGLATALALARRGFAVEVLERQPRFGEVGAGIQLAPNAFRAFDALGVGDQMRAVGVFIDDLRLMDASTAEEIVRIPVGEPFRARFGNPYAVVHRGEMHRTLLDACQEQSRIDLHTLSGVEGYDQDGTSVTVVLSSGERRRGSFLVGADGLRSKVRAQMLNDGEPRVSGHSTYRSVVPTELMPEAFRWNAATLWAGPKCHIVHYPLSGWKLFNLVITADNGADEPVTGVPVSDDHVLTTFGQIHEQALSIVRKGRDWKRWVLCDRPPTSDWVDGRVGLLGDAAHPTLQYFAQGACQAFEDAVVLAEAVEKADSVEAALASYRDERALRTARVQLQSREIGEHIYHAAGAHAALRNAIMCSRTTEEYYESLSWLYGGTGAS